MKVKFMTEKQLLKIITNGYMGDPNKGYGHDYVDDQDNILKRYWELSTAKLLNKYEQQLKEMEKQEN